MEKIKIVSKVRTADGKFFDSVDPAIDYQNDLVKSNLSKIFNEFEKKHPETHFKRIEISIIEFLVSRSKEIADILNSKASREQFDFFEEI